MKKENLIYSTLILTIASIFTRIIGMVFRVYLSNQIGAVGMGLYQMIISVYFFASTFACSGIVVAVSSLASAILPVTKENAPNIFYTFALPFPVSWGITAGAVLYFCSDVISSVLLKDMNAAFSLKNTGLPAWYLCRCPPAIVDIFWQFPKFLNLLSP